MGEEKRTKKGYASGGHCDSLRPHSLAKVYHWPSFACLLELVHHEPHLAHAYLWPILLASPLDFELKQVEFEILI